MPKHFITENADGVGTVLQEILELRYPTGQNITNKVNCDIHLEEGDGGVSLIISHPNGTQQIAVMFDSDAPPLHVVLEPVPTE